MCNVAIIGTTLSGNKGAAGMLLSALDNIPRRIPNAKFKVLTIYPRQDKELAKDIPNVEIVSCKPQELILKATPLSFLAPVLRRVGLHRLLALNRILRTLMQCDVVIDAGGITFVDGRGLVLVYNAACILPALLLGKKVIKYSQALGPFESFPNSWLARKLLPRIEKIASRGRITRAYLDSLGLTNVVDCADAAFSMRVRPASQAIAEELTRDSFFDKEVIGVSPSSVVDGYCRRKSIPYAEILARFIDLIIEERNCHILILAHSIRPNPRVQKNNDVPVCRAVYDAVRNKASCHLIVEDYMPDVLRLLIGRCRFFVASRFHAMISALGVRVPTILIGWSHKYIEVLETFGLEDYCFDYASFSLESLLMAFRRVVANEELIQDKIERALPSAITSSLRNADMVADALATHNDRIT